MTGDLAGAAELLGEALELYRTLGARLGEANALRDLGVVLTKARDFTAATDLLAQSRKLYEEVGDLQGEVEALNSTGGLLVACDEKERALGIYQQALLLACQVRSPLEEAHALEGIARCQVRTGMRTAINSLREAVSIYRRIGAAETPTASEYLTYLEACGRDL
ncbi:tetratricopeptide repeat protein [Streptomyces antimycoticus]|uniref:tetratricopeptide repeat protein n=1 Tax=Streptomyces antimycoticus TaxID=68175 RepID=UPI00342084A9